MVGRVFLGRYETLRLLGEGGMGRVYLARQIDLKRFVVVKVMHDQVAADAKFRERFQRETLLMAGFQHPFAVTLYDASLNDPQGPCIIMEYVRGITAEMLLRRNGRLTPGRVGRLLGQLCEVLQAAHNQGIIHRDLKPTNLMVVDPDTPYEHIKVMDFGLAKLALPSASPPTNLSGTDFTLGTPGYMSPEQARGEEVDQRGDLYSVGVILFELLTGQVPFAGATTMELMLAHATQTPPPFAEVGAENWAPPAIEAVVRACLAKDPRQRPDNARELADRFETALAHEEVVQEQALHGPPPLNLAPQAPQEQASQLDGPLPDPNSLSFQLEAWMPEKIAAYKLRGFVYDVGGKVVESVPGRIRMQLGGKGSVYAPTGVKSWLGLDRQSSLVDVELHLKRNDPEKESQLHITVTFRPTDSARLNGAWRNRCSQIFCDLRAYLMGRSWCS